MLQKFTLAAIVDMDGGRIREAFEQAMRRCELDCTDRPGTEKARTIELAVSLTPVCRQDGSLDSIEVQFGVQEKLPSRKSTTYNMAAERGGLFFNDLSKEEARQQTIDGVPQPKGTSNVG